MKNKAIYLLVAALFLFAISVPVSAHHGTANYDMSKTYTVKGKIIRFSFENPHVQIIFEGADDTGNVQKWQAELTSPNHLMRAGWTKDELKPGDEVTITGYRTKDGSYSLWISKILLRGEELKVGTD